MTIFKNVAITLKKMNVFCQSNTMFDGQLCGFLKEHAAHVAQVLLHCAF